MVKMNLRGPGAWEFLYFSHFIMLRRWKISWSANLTRQEVKETEEGKRRGKYDRIKFLFRNEMHDPVGRL